MAKTTHNHKVLQDELMALDVMEATIYKGGLSHNQVRSNIYVWILRSGDLQGREYATFVRRNNLYIIRIK